MRAGTILLMALLLTNPAHADDRAAARVHFERALELVDEGAFDAAVVEFERAYELSPHPTVLYNLGQAFVGLGDPVAAVDTLTRYLAEAGDSVPAARRAAVREEIEKQRARIGSLTLDVVPAGATASLDGRDVGQTPLTVPLRVGIGRHRLRISKSGFVPDEQVVSVSSGREVHVQVALTPLTASTAPAAHLWVECQVPDVQLLVDGQPLARTPVATPIATRPGMVELSWQRPGYASEPSTIELKSNTTRRVVCTLSPRPELPAAMAARLIVVPSEPHARIQVDGQLFSGDGELPTGRHWVRVTRWGFQPWQQEIGLRSGEHLELSPRLVPEATYLQDYQTRTRSRRRWSYAVGGTGLLVGAAAAGLYVWNHGRFTDWETTQSQLDAAFAAPEISDPEDLLRRQASNDDLLGSVQRVDGVVVAASLVGVTALATGTVLLVTGESPRRYDVSVEANSTGGFIGYRQAF